jgi:hypothetical protein
MLPENKKKPSVIQFEHKQEVGGWSNYQCMKSDNIVKPHV